MTRVPASEPPRIDVPRIALSPPRHRWVAGDSPISRRPTGPIPRRVADLLVAPT
jgi:hypothetical protein